MVFLLKNLWPHPSEFTSGLVVYLSGFKTVPYCFDYCSSVTCFETGKYKFPKVSKCFSFQYFGHVEYIEIAYEFQSKISYSCLINSPPNSATQTFTSERWVQLPTQECKVSFMSTSLRFLSEVVYGFQATGLSPSQLGLSLTFFKVFSAVKKEITLLKSFCIIR